MLYDPVVDGTSKEVYLARGCFGIVCLKIYRGLQVAVKRLLPRSLLTDVKNEATTLASLCHPYLRTIIFWIMYQMSTLSDCDAVLWFERL